MNKFAGMAKAINEVLDKDLYQQEAMLLGSTLDEQTIDKIAAYEEAITQDEEVKEVNLPQITILKLAEQMVFEEMLETSPEYVERVKTAAALGEKAADLILEQVMTNNE